MKQLNDMMRVGLGVRKMLSVCPHNPQPTTHSGNCLFQSCRAQSILEFTFSTIVFLAMVSGMVLIFRWAMMDLAERRFDHDRNLTVNSLTPEQQLAPDFHRVRAMDTFLFKKP